MRTPKLPHPQRHYGISTPDRLRSRRQSCCSPRAVMGPMTQECCSLVAKVAWGPEPLSGPHHWTTVSRTHVLLWSQNHYQGLPTGRLPTPLGDLSDDAKDAAAAKPFSGTGHTNVVLWPQKLLWCQSRYRPRAIGRLCQGRTSCCGPRTTNKVGPQENCPPHREICLTTQKMLRPQSRYRAHDTGRLS